MAFSLICATKKLSTILYREFTSIEMTIGKAMDRISGKTGFSFINVSFIENSFQIKTSASAGISEKSVSAEQT